jgi:putative peptidoglycan lipid II flippase
VSGDFGEGITPLTVDAAGDPMPAPTTAGDLARAGLVVSGAFLLARVLGYVRVVVIGTTFGPSVELDAFFAAFRLPDLLFQLVAAGAMSASLIPIVSGLHGRREDERAWRVASTVATFVLVVLLVFAIVLALAAPVLIPAIVSFDPAGTELTVNLTRVMLLSPILLAIGGIASSMLNAWGRFGASAAAPLIYNLGIIGAAVFLAPTMGVEALAIGVVIGAVGHVAIQLRPLRQTGFQYRPNLQISDPDARQALALMLPRALGLGAGQITFVVATSLASGLATGSVSAFTFAFTVFTIPLGVIGVPIGIVTLPSMARDLARGDVGHFVELVTRSIRLVAYVILPIVAIGIVLRTEAITVLFNYGQFTAQGIALTAEALAPLLLALPAEGMITILVRAFYANRDTLTPVVAAVFAVAINIVVAVTAVHTLGLGLTGIAIGIPLGSWAELMLLFFVLNRRVRTFHLWPVVWSVVTALLAAALAALTAAVVERPVADALQSISTNVAALAGLVLAGSAGALVYVGASLALKVPELPLIGRLLVETMRGLPWWRQ